MMTKKYLAGLVIFFQGVHLIAGETQGAASEGSTLLLVMAVILVIWFGISAYLVILDRKTKKLESELNNEKKI